MCSPISPSSSLSSSLLDLLNCHVCKVYVLCRQSKAIYAALKRLYNPTTAGQAGMFHFHNVISKNVLSNKAASLSAEAQAVYVPREQ